MTTGKGHKQATPNQIATLRARLEELDANGSNAMVARYRWYLSDRVLHRFITARNGDVEVALKMLLNHLQWRADYGMDNILEEDMSHLDLEREFYWSGFDVEGRPCLVFRACMHRRSESDNEATPEQKIRYYCQLLERGFRDFAPAFKFCLILDCRGAGRDNMDRKLMKIATPIIENNFPETQHATYVLPCGPLILMAWKLMSSFIDPGTADKIRLLSSFDDPSLKSCFTPETLKAFVTLDPSKASPQPYVEPDPLGNSPPVSASSATPSDIVDASLEVPASTSSASPVADANAIADATAASISSVTDAEPPPSSPGAPSTAVRTLPPPSPGGTLDELSPAGDLDFDDGPFAIDGGDDTVQEPRGMGAVVNGSGQVRKRIERAISDTEYSCKGVSPSSQADEDAANAGATAVEFIPGSTTASATATASAPASTSGFPSASGSLSAPKSGGANSHRSTISPAYGPGLAGGGAAAGSGDRGGFGTRSSPAITEAPSAVSANGWRPVGSSQAGTCAGSLNSAESRAGGSGRVINKSFATGRTDGHLASEGRFSETGGGGGDHSLLGEVDGRNGAAFRTLDTVEKTGYLYKRRDNLRGRFAYRRRHAALRFPRPHGSKAADGARTFSAAPGAYVYTMPGGGPASGTPPPTLALFKSRGHGESEKLISLEGAEVKLGKSKAGALYPFVVVFPSNQPPQQHNYVHEPHEEALSRRNTEDFTFPGSGIALSSNMTRVRSSRLARANNGGPGATADQGPNEGGVGDAILGRSRGGGNNPDLDDIDEDDEEEEEDDDDDSEVPALRAGGRFSFPAGVFGSVRDMSGRGNSISTLGGGGGAEHSGSSQTRRYRSFRPSGKTQRGNSHSLSPSRSQSSNMLQALSSMDASFNGRSSSRGSRHSTTTRRTLHLACETEEEALEWARWIADAAVWHEASTEVTWVSTVLGSLDPDGGLNASPVRGGGAGKGVQALQGAGAAVALGRDAAEGGAREGDGSGLSYRLKYAQALAALAAVTDDLVGEGGEDASQSTGKRRSFNILRAYRRGKAAGLLDGAALDTSNRSKVGEVDGSKRGDALPPSLVDDLERSTRRRELNDSRHESEDNSDGGSDDGCGASASGVLSRNGSTNTIAASSSLGGSPFRFRGRGMKRRKKKRGHSAPRAPAAGSRRGQGDARRSLLSMRDSEITRLRRAYARAELSRGEMKQCLRALAVQLKEGEDRTGALLADKEALVTKVDAKDAELKERVAVLEERDSRATSEARAKEQLLENLKVENQALQAALERLRLDAREHRVGSDGRIEGGSYHAPEHGSDMSCGVPGIVAAGARNRRSSTGGVGRGGHREGVLPPRPSGLHHGAPNPAGQRPVVGNGGGSAAVSTQCSLLSLGSSSRKQGGTAGVSGNHPDAVSCCSARSAGSTGHVCSSSKARPGDSPSCSCPSASSTAQVSMYSNCSGAAPMSGVAGGVCGVRGDAASGGSDVEHGDRGDDVAPVWEHGSIVSGGEGWDNGGRTPRDNDHGDEIGEDEVLEEWSPWILNGDEEQGVVVDRPAREVLSSLLDSLGDIVGEHPEAGGMGGGVERRGKRVLGDELAFRDWERLTEELQGVPRPEEVDLPGEKSFTEGCLKLLRTHAALVLGKDHREGLTEREASRMAYAIGGDIYTVTRLEAHVAALVAGLPTE